MRNGVDFTTGDVLSERGEEMNKDMKTNAEAMRVSREGLQKILGEVPTIWGEVTAVAKSGLSRRVRILAIRYYDGKPEILDITRRVASTCDYPVYKGEIRLAGGGFCPIDSIYHELSRVLNMKGQLNYIRL